VTARPRRPVVERRRRGRVGEDSLEFRLLTDWGQRRYQRVVSDAYAQQEDSLYM
jgi:hypothetical protein